MEQRSSRLSHQRFEHVERSLGVNGRALVYSGLEQPGQLSQARKCHQRHAPDNQPDQFKVRDALDGRAFLGTQLAETLRSGYD